MDTVYFDWNKSYINVIFEGDDEDIKLPDLDDLLAMLTEPTEIIGEATFHSFLPERRAKFIADCEKAGHTLLTIPTRATGRLWKELEKQDPERWPRDGKDDSIAVQVIRLVANSKTHLKKPAALPDPEWVAKREAANHELMILRSTFRWTTGPRGGRKIVSAKDDFADKVIEELPPFESLTPTQKIALGDGKGYSKIAVAAVAIAAQHADSTREFDKLTGLYHHGYPSQIRSDLHHWRWRMIRKTGAITLTDYRRELRWLYHQLSATAKTSR